MLDFEETEKLEVFFSKFPWTLWTELHLYIGPYTKNLLYQTVLHTHEQKKCTLLWASHVSSSKKSKGYSVIKSDAN